MKNKKLLNLIRQGESDSVAFLISLEIEQMAVILSSFLNHKGGNLVIGISSSQDVIGVEGDISIEELRHQITKIITPEAPIEIIEESVEEKVILILKVSEGTKQPYVCKDSIYMRLGVATKKASTEDVAQLIKNRQKDELHWERQVSFGVDEEDLDIKLIRNLMEKAQSNGRSTYKGDDYLEFLNHYGLFNNGSFTNACVILFAKNASKYFPQTRVRLTEYQNNKTDKGLLRDDVIEGNLFKIRTSLENYVENMGVRSTFSNNEWRRIDFKYPEKALQEGIVNALIHRDYSRFNTHLTISVYPDSFVIANSGKLPEELKVGDLKKNHRSFPSNPDIAHIIFLMGYIDKLGRGTMKILEECKYLGLREPKWTSAKHEVVLTFYGPDINLGEKDVYQKYPLIDSLVESTFESEIKVGVKKKLKDILIVVSEFNGITYSDLLDKVNVPTTSFKRYLQLLKDKDLLSQFDDGGYFVTNDNE